MNRHNSPAEQSRMTGGRDADPGALIYAGGSSAQPVTITVIDYDRSHLDERTCTRPEDLRALILRPTITWVNVDGIHDAGIIEVVGDVAGIHPLTLEDIENIGQRPKIEDYGDYLYVAVRAFSAGQDGFQSEQVSLILGRNYVISFLERPDDLFLRIRERLRTGSGRLRAAGADYLFYSLLDAIVDGYFAVIEDFGDRIEEVEEVVVAEPDRDTLQSIYALKRSLVLLRRSTWPLRDVMVELERGDSLLIHDTTRAYLRDVYDHVIQVAEAVEIYREAITGTLDVYLSSQSNQMNEIMKILTIIATIFIPLTFIAGLYSMNFVYMPEFGHPWGHPGAFILMAIIAITMFLYFRRKGWI